MNERFALPELPPVCVSCGAHSPLAPRKFVFNITTSFTSTLMLMSPLIWAIYSRRTAYRPELPICGKCSGHLQSAKGVSVIASLLFVLLLAGAIMVAMDYPFVFFVPIAFGLAAYIYHGTLLKRGMPKVKLADKNNLILFIPDYGEFRLYESEKASGRRGATQRTPEPTSTLKRSVCGGCGFINFSGATECKKCRTPLRRTAAA